MFEVLKDMVKEAKKLNWKRTQNKVFKAVFSMPKVQSLIIKLNQDKQLFAKGIDSKGESLGEYSEYTKELKYEDNLPFDRITLFQTGEFYDSFKVKARRDHFVIIADPIKIDDDGEESNLFEDFGLDILGLTEESKEKVIEFIKPLIIEEYKKILQFNQ